MNPGYVYIIRNPAFPKYIKIGKTRKRVQLRVADLSNASVPFPFEVAYKIYVPNCSACEALIHAKLKDYRLSGKEFFECSTDQAVSVALSVTADLFSPMEINRSRYEFSLKIKDERYRAKKLLHQLTKLHKRKKNVFFSVEYLESISGEVQS